MLVYGDVVRAESAALRLARLRDMLRDAAARPRGIARHGALIAALIEAGELAQGIADLRFEAAGERDRRSPEADAAMTLVMALAARCAASWFSGFAQDGADCTAELDACAALLPPDPIETRQPEGYAFYALYPETYLEAARALAAARAGRWRVVGIRSIGTSLAALVAMELGAPCPFTLRPAGHPFQRQIMADASERRPTSDGDTAWAIVDEGPGLSGSSFAAVARWLEGAGIAFERQHFFTSHAQGPGAQTSEAIRSVWRRVQVQHRSFDEAILHAAHPAHRLDGWVEALIGRLRAPLRDITGGGWRALHGCAEKGAAAPPAHPWQERRKFLAETDAGPWLVKFVGLGRRGERLLERARELAAAGFSPAPAGLCHGFLVERWHGDMRPLSGAMASNLRERLVERIADYLSFRARSFAAAPDSGASLQRLCEMGRYNSGQALGAHAAAAWQPLSAAAERLASAVARVETDSRLHAWEWLAAGERLLKTDALDHHAGHDLIGCQDIAWDVAGAAVEFDLAPAEQRRLVGRMAAREEGVRVRQELVGFYRPCYLAFQLGYWRMAHDAAGGASPEAARLHASCARYAAGLRRALGLAP